MSTQLTEQRLQQPPHLPMPTNAGSGGWLGNRTIQQMPGSTTMEAPFRTRRLAVSRLDWLKAEHFTPGNRGERIAASLNALRAPNTIKLSREDWMWVLANSEMDEDPE